MSGSITISNSTMKTRLKMKNTLILIAAMSLLGLMGCNGGHDAHGSGQDSLAGSNKEAGTPNAAGYVCPMHPEQRSSTPGKCPECGMDMVPVKEGPSVQYVMNHETDPAQAEAGKAVTLKFRPAQKDAPGKEVALDLMHEKKIHLIMVSDDLQWFAHEHPAYQSDGSYTHSQKFPNGGKYHLFADYKPSGGEGQLEHITLDVSGKPAASKSDWKGSLTASVDGYQVKLSTANGKVQSGSLQHITGTVLKGGQEIDANTLEDYLGAKAHVVVIGLQDKDYLHVHPDVEGKALDLHGRFAKPGIYRMWLQFQTGGKVHTADFVLDVTEGPEMSDDHGHDHGAGGHEHGDHEHGDHEHGDEGHSH